MVWLGRVKLSEICPNHPFAGTQIGLGMKLPGGSKNESPPPKQQEDATSFNPMQAAADAVEAQARSLAMAANRRAELASKDSAPTFSKPAIHLGEKSPLVQKDGKAARIMAVWGYDGHSLELTPEEWYAIRCGEEVFIAGPGYAYEGHDFNDTWIFNGGEYELVVLYSNENEDGVGYNGSLRGVEIEEFLPQR